MSCKGKTTLDKGGRDPPDVSLEDIVIDLSSYLYKIDIYRDTKTEAEEKYGIIKEHGDCWPPEIIKQAWEETQTMEETSPRRRHWSVVIMMQLMQTQNNYRSEDGIVYICIPRIAMIQNEREEQQFRNIKSRFKLIDRVPGTGHIFNDIRRRKSYVMSFNHQTRNANWVYEILNRSTVPRNPVRAVSFGDPYQRGHLAAAANQKWCCEALDDANMIDNIVPQHKALNTGPWSALEEFCRSRAKAENNIRNVHVYSGPLYLREMNPPVIQGKQVPSHFFKVIIEENEDGTVELQCHRTPNGNLPGENLRTDTSTTIEEIQRDSGLTFMAIRPNVGQNAMASEITVSLHGEDENRGDRAADIRVTTSLLF